MIGCRAVEEQFGAFFVEGWPSFDAVMKHIGAMRELQRTSGIVWQTVSYLGAKIE